MSSRGAPGGNLLRVRREVARRTQLVVGAAHALRHRRPPGERLWLLGGFVGAAFGDNSAALFRYLRRARPDINAVWAIDSNAADAAAAAAVGPTVDHAGRAAAALAWTAEALVISHGLHDVPGFASRFVRGVRVRVGHGLTAFKKTKPPTGRSADSLARLYDVVPVASAFERDNKTQWGISPAALPVCGVCRFDDLVRLTRESPPKNKILYMPTWRDWLGADANAVNDPTVVALIDFASSPRLAALLERFDCQLDVYAHRLLADVVRTRLSQGSGRRVRLATRDEDVQHLMAESRMLITDYSSTTWDMLYVDRPVLFFTPDVEKYQQSRGAYFDLTNDLPGPGAHTPDAAIDLVEAALDASCPLSAAALRWQQRAFAHRDDRNCERVVAAVEASLRQRGRP